MTKEVTLACLFWPADTSEAVTITVDVESNISQIKEALFRGPYASQLASVNILELKLWKCAIPVDANCNATLDTLRFDGADTRLQVLLPPLRVVTYFKEGEVPRDCIHIVFQLPKPDTPPASVGIPNPITNELLSERKKFNAGISNLSHWAQAAPSDFSRMQDNPNQAIGWSRPCMNGRTIPVTLYHSVFRQFVDDCNDHRPTAADNALALELCFEMSGFFPDEEARAAEFRDILQKHGISLSESSIGSKDFEYLTDGDIQVDGHRIVILMVKNEICGGRAEPYAQAILSYMHSTRPATERFPMFNFPCLILTLFGPHISFSGAVWDTRPHFQILSPALSLFAHHTDIDMRATLARHLGALRKAIRTLTECYTATLAGEPSNSTDHLAPCFPDPHQYHFLVEPKGVAVHFEYIYQLHRDKMFFMAKTDDSGSDDTRICVKFVRQYSRDVHEKCASMGIAPRLKGFEHIGGGWTMVVMDALDEDYVRIHDLEPETPIPNGVRDGLREKLAGLHQSHLVHGDIRDTNILIKGNGEEGFMVLDFDWAGVVGEVRYPMNVYRGDGLWRPDGAVDGELIQPEHDMAMLDHLLTDKSFI